MLVCAIDCKRFPCLGTDHATTIKEANRWRWRERTGGFLVPVSRVDDGDARTLQSRVNFGGFYERHGPGAGVSES